MSDDNDYFDDPDSTSVYRPLTEEEKARYAEAMARWEKLPPGMRRMELRLIRRELTADGFVMDPASKNVGHCDEVVEIRVPEEGE